MYLSRAKIVNRVVHYILYYAALKHGDQKVPGSDIPYVVHLSDRITNLQPPPNYWTAEKIANYRQEAMLIYKELHEGNTYLAERLWNEIEKYQ